MNLSMYCDSEKNIMMIHPEGVPDEVFLAIGKRSFLFPTKSVQHENGKINAIIDLSNSHADYPLDCVMVSNLIEPL